MASFLDADARSRLLGLFDAGSFEEFLPDVVSPHLAQLNAPAAPGDGVVVGRARLAGRRVLAASQDGHFMGGAVGEVHGAKLVGLLRRAAAERPHAVLLLLESGGARLHEANASMIAISEVMRALLDARAAGVPVIALIGGANGAFGGIGLIARCANAIVIAEGGRLAMSGPKVIETASGIDEFDASDAALVWRTTGARHRYLLGDCQAVVPDSMAAFRQAAQELAAGARGATVELTLEGLEREQQMLAERIERFGAANDPLDIWGEMGIAQPAAVPAQELNDFLALAAAHKLGAK